MSATINPRNFATMMGAWPYAYKRDGSTPYLLSGVFDAQATILGFRHNAAGYDVDTLSFKLHVDGNSNTVVFSTKGTNWTLQEVIDEINDDVTVPFDDVAFAENGFLRLKSPTSGSGGSLRLEAVGGSESVFDELGFYSGLEVTGGDPAQPAHYDPTRQVALPQQGAMLWGETFNADVFNRAAMQIALQADRAAGLLDRKRVAIKREFILTGYNGSDTSFQLVPTDGEPVYTGGLDYADPNFETDSFIAILDEDGNEIVKESSSILDTAFVAQATFSVNSDGELEIVSAFISFTSNDTKNDVFIVSSAAPVPAALQGVPMKIIRYISGSEAILAPIDPTNGDVTTFSGACTGNVDRVLITAEKVAVDGFYKEVGLSTHVEQLQEVKQSSTPVTRIEGGNRIYCDGANFSSVIPGDIVEWVSYGGTTPYSNNSGSDPYRVLEVVDNKTLVLCSPESGPILLNPTSGTLGSVIVSTDGDFWVDPYIKFANSSILPDAGDLRIVFRGSSSVRDAVGEFELFGDLKYSQETPRDTIKALLGIVGPSVNSLSDVLGELHGNAGKNIEDLYFNLEKEHYVHDDDEAAGRHSTIRPDVVDMQRATTGETIIAKSANSTEDTPATAAVKIALKSSGGTNLFEVDSTGRVGIGVTAPDQSLHIHGQSGEEEVIKLVNTGLTTKTWLGFYHNDSVTVDAKMGIISTIGGVPMVGLIAEGYGYLQSEKFFRIRADKDGIDSAANIEFQIHDTTHWSVQNSGAFVSGEGDDIGLTGSRVGTVFSTNINAANYLTAADMILNYNTADGVDSLIIKSGSAAATVWTIGADGNIEPGAANVGSIGATKKLGYVGSQLLRISNSSGSLGGAPALIYATAIAQTAINGIPAASLHGGATSSAGDEGGTGLTVTGGASTNANPGEGGYGIYGSGGSGSNGIPTIGSSGTAGEGVRGLGGSGSDAGFDGGPGVVGIGGEAGSGNDEIGIGVYGLSGSVGKTTGVLNAGVYGLCQLSSNDNSAGVYGDSKNSSVGVIARNTGGGVPFMLIGKLETSITATPQLGWIYYDTGLNKLRVWTGSWETVASS